MPYMTEELSPAKRAKLPAKDFIFPKSRTWPIQNRKQAKTALTYATWDQHKDVAGKVRKAVFKRYPDLKGWANVGKSKYKAPWQKRKRRRQESVGFIGDIPGMADRLGALSEMIRDSQEGVHHDPAGIGRDDGILEGRSVTNDSITSRKFNSVMEHMNMARVQLEQARSAAMAEGVSSEVVKQTIADAQEYLNQAADIVIEAEKQI